MTAVLNSTGIEYINGNQTTSNMNTFAAAAVGSVGSYALMRVTASAFYSTNGFNGAAPVGSTIAGSSLTYANSYGLNQTVNTTATGTWKLFGTTSVGYAGSGYSATLFMRIA